MVFIVEFIVGEGKLMIYDEFCFMVLDDKYDFILGICLYFF